MGTRYRATTKHHWHSLRETDTFFCTNDVHMKCPSLGLAASIISSYPYPRFRQL